MRQAVSVDVQQVLDQQAFGGYHLKVALLCGLAVLTDGFDAQSMGFVAPALAQDWHIARSALGPILTAGLVGMLIGALIFGPLADRFGRRKILVFCTLWFGTFSLLTSFFASSIQSMLILRLFTGFGLGGTLPNAIALTSEYMPRKARATGVMLMFTGFSIGAAAGGFVAASLIGRFGWHSVFLVGGIDDLLVMVLLLIGLPESIRFLVLKGGSGAEAAALLNKVAPQVEIGPDTQLVVSDHRQKGFIVKQLFADDRATLTLLLWVIFFMSLLDLYFLNSWLPTVLRDSGLPLNTAIRMTAMFQVGGAVGAFLLGRTFDKKKSFTALALAYAGAAVSVFFIGMAGASLMAQALLVFLAGICVVGGQTGSNAMAAESYVTSIRSTGVGWALGIGRIGSIAGPLIGGVLLSSQMEMKRVFWFAAVPPIIAVIAALLVSRRVAQRRVV